MTELFPHLNQLQVVVLCFHLPLTPTMSSLRADAGLGHLTQKMLPKQLGNLQEKKKTLECHPYPRGPVPSFSSPPTSSRCSPVRGSRTGGSGSADRSGFGCPQSIKRRQGVPLAKKGWTNTFQDLLRTERVGFEPTRVLPLHDFESCAINRTLPPLQTPSGAPKV